MTAKKTETKPARTRIAADLSKLSPEKAAELIAASVGRRLPTTADIRATANASTVTHLDKAVVNTGHIVSEKHSNEDLSAVLADVQIAAKEILTSERGKRTGIMRLAHAILSVWDIQPRILMQSRGEVTDMPFPPLHSPDKWADKTLPRVRSAVTAYLIGDFDKDARTPQQRRDRTALEASVRRAFELAMAIARVGHAANRKALHLYAVPEAVKGKASGLPTFLLPLSAYVSTDNFNHYLEQTGLSATHLRQLLGQQFAPIDGTSPVLVWVVDQMGSKSYQHVPLTKVRTTIEAVKAVAFPTGKRAAQTKEQNGARKGGKDATATTGVAAASLNPEQVFNAATERAMKWSRVTEKQADMVKPLIAHLCEIAPAFIAAELQAASERQAEELAAKAVKLAAAKNAGK